MERQFQIELTIKKIQFCIYTDCIVGIRDGINEYHFKGKLYNCQMETNFDETLRFTVLSDVKRALLITIFFSDEVDVVGEASFAINLQDRSGLENILHTLPIQNDLNPDAQVEFYIKVNDIGGNNPGRNTPIQFEEVYRKPIPEQSEKSYNSSAERTHELDKKNQHQRIGGYASYGKWHENRQNLSKQLFQNKPIQPSQLDKEESVLELRRWEESLRKGQQKLKSREQPLISPRQDKHEKRPYENKLKKKTTEKSNKKALKSPEKSEPRSSDQKSEAKEKGVLYQRITKQNEKYKSYIEKLEKENMTFKFRMADLEIQMKNLKKEPKVIKGKNKTEQTDFSESLDESIKHNINESTSKKNNNTGFKELSTESGNNSEKKDVIQDLQAQINYLQVMIENSQPRESKFHSVDTYAPENHRTYNIKREKVPSPSDIKLQQSFGVNTHLINTNSSKSSHQDSPELPNRNLVGQEVYPREECPKIADCPSSSIDQSQDIGLVEKLLQENQFYKQQLAEYKKNDEALQQENAHLLDQITEYEQNIDALNEMTLQMKDQLKIFKQNENWFMTRIQELEAIIENKQRDYDMLADRASGSVKMNLVPLQQENQMLAAQNSQLKQENFNLITQVQALQQETQELLKKLHKVEESYLGFQVKEHGYHEQIFALQDQIREVKQTLADNINLILEYGGIKLIEQVQTQMGFKTSQCLKD